MKRFTVLIAMGALALACGRSSAVVPAQRDAAGAAPVAVEIAPMVHPTDAALASPPTTAACRTKYHFACYRPAQLERAYDLPPLYKRGYDGHGRTIVIVDAFGSLTVKHDLNVFDKTFGLPAPPSIKVIQPAGPVGPTSHPGWAWETNLDVQWAHAIAPGANILVVETPKNENEGTSGFPQIVQAENYVVRHNLGDVISQSFGATEPTFPGAKQLLALRSAYVDAHNHGVSVLAASSDSGATDYTSHDDDLFTYPVVDWPGSDPLVTNVSGTQLHLNAQGVRTSPDTVWNDTFDKAVQIYFDGSPAPTATAGGGGQSIFFSRPSYQRSVRAVAGSHRAVPDVSMSAACSGAGGGVRPASRGRSRGGG